MCVVQVVTKHGRELKSGGYYKHGQTVMVSYMGNYGRCLGRERVQGSSTAIKHGVYRPAA